MTVAHLPFHPPLSLFADPHLFSLRLFPLSVITRDAPLRIAFAAFLLALKVTSDCSHLNKSFVHYTPWKLHDLNAMEKQLLEYLGFDLWISSEE